MKSNQPNKKLIFIILFLAGFLSITSSRAQIELWGMTSEGGDYGTGTIFKTDEDGNNHTVVYNPFKYDGQGPNYTQLCEASNGLLYGMTVSGGENWPGVLFEYNPADGSYTVKVDFEEIAQGYSPHGSLIQASNGLLYGMTRYGGANDNGVLFEYNPTNGSYTIKIDFDGTAKGSNPRGSLVQASNGMLYGMTASGGVNADGVLFEFNPADGSYTKKFDFDDTANGREPWGNLTQASNGMLYGMTRYGGTNGRGVLFEYDPDDNIITKKIDFSWTASGGHPFGSLINTSDGLLYGMTRYGGTSGYGVLFEFNPGDDSFTKKIDFDGTAKGREPNGNLIQASNGILYGMTSKGGVNGSGVLFEYNPSNGSFTKKFNFDGTSNGHNPLGSLVQVSNGMLYGMTSGGGLNNDGVLFTYNPVTTIYTKNFDFGETPDGYEFNNSLVQISNGLLYGVTSSGGSNNYGVLFEYNSAEGTFTKKLDFDGTTGGSPYGSLVQASNGMLYGMTSSGGTNDDGVIFEYNPATETYVKKVDFETSKGIRPSGSLLEASNGLLYGVTQNGGTNNDGVLFEYNPSDGTYIKKVDFDGTSKGRSPSGSLVEASNGLLYGFTQWGGTNDLGVVFEYNPANGNFSIKVEFDGTPMGRHPIGSLEEASNGLLYGMARNGGASYYGGGVLFEYNPTNGNFTKKFNFDGTSKGRDPIGGLIQASNGLLYGMTHSGGVNDYGVLFEYNPTDGSFIKKLDFNGTNGKNPAKTILIEVVAGSNWTGDNSSEWTDTGNWEFDEVPTQAMNVTIPSSYINPPVIETDAIAHNLTIDGGNLDIIEEGKLSLTGELVNNGKLTIQSNVQGTGSFIDNGTTSGGGNYSIERFMETNGWHYFGSPIASGTANIFLGMYLQIYSETDETWMNITDENTPLDPMKGYALWNDAAGSGNTFYFNDSPNTGNFSMPVTADNPNGWNLLSNPYPSTIDWELVDKSEINGAIYYFDAESMSYVSYIAGIGDGSRYIPPMQGFFISAPAAGTLSFNNSVRSHEQSGTYYKSSGIFSNYLEIKTSGNGLSDKAYMRFLEEATPGFDGDFDAYKMFTFSEEVPQVFFIADENQLSINCLPEANSVELGFSAGVSGEYTISIEEITDIAHVVLEDKKNNEKTNLLQSSYTFQYSPIDITNRFVLHFSTMAVDEPVQSKLQVYTSGNTLYIKSPDMIEKANVKIFDIAGHRMKEIEFHNSKQFHNSLELATGYYLVSVQTGSEIVSRKVFVQ